MSQSIPSRIHSLAFCCLTAFVLLLGISHATSAAEIASATLDKDGGEVFFDQDLGLRILGLEPASQAILTVTATDAREQVWWSQNVYIADESGELDLSQQSPIRGTYGTDHGMGPFWSMVGHKRFDTSSAAEVLVQVSDDRAVVAERSFRWLSPRDHAGVEKQEIREPGLVADLYLPSEAEGPMPAVVVVGGSGGGFNSERASLLAAHGYAALDVAYFGVDGTPLYFVETRPLEYFKAAVGRLAEHPRVDDARIAIMGKSYGAQLALLLASHEPRLRLVIAEAPSSYVTGTPGTYPVGPVLSAWSLGGEPLPFLNSEREGPVSPQQITVKTSGELALEAEPGARRAAIAAERIGGPVLLISGQSDSLWASTIMADQLVRRMADHAFPHPVRHVSYPDAGHNLGGGEQAYGVPNLPPKDRRDRSGGTREGNSIAGSEAWAEVLAFLRSHL